jgi:hypothetical protein
MLVNNGDLPQPEQGVLTETLWQASRPQTTYTVSGNRKQYKDIDNSKSKGLVDVNEIFFLAVCLLCLLVGWLICLFVCV